MEQTEQVKETASMRKTKRALIASAICTLLCGLLLFSTSIAWFSSTKESAANELCAGNLDVVLSYSKTMNNNDWHDVKEATDIFKVGDKNMLWEPGATNVVYFKIENKGSLAAKYDFALVIGEETAGMNFDGQPFKLSDYIYGGVVEMVAGSTAYTADASGRAEARSDISGKEKKLSAISGMPLITDELDGIPVVGTSEKQEKTFALVLYMPDTASSDTNYKTGTDQPKVPLSVKLVATQMTGESDSFGSEYDKYAEHPDFTVEDDSAFSNAINTAKNGDVIAVRSDITLETEQTLNKNITIVGDGNSVIKHSPIVIGPENTVTFKNMKFDETTATDKASSVYARNFKGTLVFDGCTFGLNKWESVQVTPDGDCTIVFNNCTFNGYDGARRFIHIQPSSSNTYKLDVTITNCTFNNCDKVNFKNDDDNKGSVIDLDYFAPGSTVTMGNNTFSLSSGVTNYPLHPYFCMSPYAEASELCGDTLLNYLKDDIKTYEVTTTAGLQLKAN